jgi:two-component system sensor histidine kinase AlgZ
MNRRNPAPAEDTLFLPDFCALRTLLAIVLAGQFLAFLLVLAPTRVGGDGWRDLAFGSLFVQWVGVSSAAILCASRGLLKRFSNVAAGFVSYAIVLLVTLVLSEAGFLLLVNGIVPVQAFSINVPPHWDGGPPAMVTFLKTPQHVELLLRNLGISAIVSAIALRYFYVQHQWKTNLESEHRARIQALQSRIRPHFLFNSMNTIAALTRSDPERAEEVTEDLAALFRVSLGDASVPVSLSRELEVCRQYLHIEKQRLGDRIADRWEIERLPPSALIPGLSLQPLVENAVYHGIEPSTGGGVIEISGGKNGSRLWIRIANSRPGDNGRNSRPVGNQMAQENVSQRMRAFFGDGAELQVKEDESTYAVELRFPLVTDDGSGAPSR